MNIVERISVKIGEDGTILLPCLEERNQEGV